MSYENKRIAVIGAGSFGTALAMTLSGRGHTVTMWARRKEQIEEMSKEHSNSHYLPGVVLPEELLFTDNLEDAVSGKDLLLFAVPAQKFREVFAEAMKYADVQIPIVNVAKGIEKGTLLRLSEVAEEISPNCKFIALSGPSHAEEVARRMPTTVVVAGKDHDLAYRRLSVRTASVYIQMRTSSVWNWEVLLRISLHSEREFPTVLNLETTPKRQ